MRTGKSGVRSQKSEVGRFLFWILNSVLCILVSASFAQDTLKESLSDLNRILPAKKVVNDEWGRDPFAPIVGERFVSMKLTAIIYNDKKPAAIVNNKIIYVGDSVDGQKVVDITKQYVILRGMSGSYKLEIGNTSGEMYDIKKTQ
jgi:hypothetical protein